MNTHVKKTISASQVKIDAEGRWLEILVTIDPLLENAVSKLGSHVPSPVRGGVNGFRLFNTAATNGAGVDNQEGVFPDGISLLMWSTGRMFRPVLEDIHNLLEGWGANTPVFEFTEKAKLNVVESKGDIRKLESLWRRCSTIGLFKGDYFKNRGISLDLKYFDCMRFNNKLFTKENVNGVFESYTYPGIVCKVTDVNGELVSLHRSFLSINKALKAPLSSSKKLMAVAKGKHMAGASIKLGYPLDGVLGISEGLETALSVTQLMGITCWPTVNTFGMKTFVPPSGVHTVIIFGDKDSVDPATGVKPGLKAATFLKEKLEKNNIRCVRIFPKEDIPKGEKSIDWNDVLVNSGRYPTLEVIKASV